ncbi:acyltransferase family protein [Variovorax sp. PAMC26660]|uniref:acyltransferase family protein n=1 Tax=Variovorax sp. PAMC26660 TaxID=2762322 RepID=UPI00164D60A9|nr:acyltransferase [Variovorax sp. PAMC26660]QNK65832.1 acyltransferase [Variovorax sp. PAMC26660]
MHFLDGLRGWGSLVVLMAHVYGEGFPISDQVTAILSKLVVFNAGLAVWIFFLVSGFSLAIGFCRNRDSNVLVKVALGRYVRLAVPIFCAAAVLYLLFALGFVLPAEQRLPKFQNFLPLAPSLWDVVRFSFFDTFFAYSYATTLIGPLWTMPFELWGSCLVLGTLFVVGRLERRFYVYAVLGAVSFFINPIFSAFVVGMVLAEVHVSDFWKRNAIGLSAPAFLVFLVAFYGASLLPKVGPNPEWAYLIVASLLTISCVFSKTLSTFLSGRLSRFLGRISFPLYLIHGPLMLSYANMVYRWVGDPTDAQKVLLNLSTVALCIACATLLAPIDRWGVAAAKHFSSYVMGRKSAARQAAEQAAK